MLLFRIGNEQCIFWLTGIYLVCPFYYNFVFQLLAITCDTAPTTTHGSNDCTGSTAHTGTCTATCDSGFYTATTTYTCGDSDNDGVGDFNSITCAGLLMHSVVDQVLWYNQAIHVLVNFSILESSITHTFDRIIFKNSCSEIGF